MLRFTVFPRSKIRRAMATSIKQGQGRQVATSARKEVLALYFYRLGDSAGGAERMVCELARALTRLGFKVHLVSWDEASAKSFYALDPAVTWHRLGFRRGLADKLRRAVALTRLLRQHGVSVLIGFVMSGDRTVFAAAKLGVAKLIAAERNSPVIYRLRYRWFERMLAFAFLHLADRIVVQFPDYIRGYPATLRHRIEVIPNPVAVASRLAQPARRNAAGRFTVLAVSRLDAGQKRLDGLICAFARIVNAHPDWDLLIIGSGPQSEMLRNLAAENGVSNRFCLQEPTSEIFKAYAEAHLFAIPSFWEGFPNALAEALAHGLPAVGFREASGVAELIREGETGWLADGLDDEASLAESLSEAMTDDAERARRGAQASRSMVAYAPEVQFHRWNRLIHLLTTSRAVP
jgi:glycosyltransferase involved in cell wall biosynthesis